MPTYQEGDVVNTDDGLGVVTGVFTHSINWPTSEDPEKDISVDGTEDNPVYIVSFVQQKRSKPFREGELTPDEFEDPEAPDMEKVVDDMTANNSQPYPAWYDDLANPNDLNEVQSELASRVRNKNVSVIAETRGTSDMSYEELIDVPGVDDPGVGFDSWPDSWEESEKPARLIALQAWASMGGTWRGCFREMSTNMTPRGARRFCSSFKDEIYGSEQWRQFSG